MAEYGSRHAHRDKLASIEIIATHLHLTQVAAAVYFCRNESSNPESDIEHQAYAISPYRMLCAHRLLSSGASKPAFISAFKLHY